LVADYRPGPTLSAASLFADMSAGTLGYERFEALLDGPGIRLERIVSTGQTTPDVDWFDQTVDEWVVLLRGRAELLIEGEAVPRALAPND
jgi:cupin 2 domain-containing protein